MAEFERHSAEQVAAQVIGGAEYTIAAAGLEVQQARELAEQQSLVASQAEWPLTLKPNCVRPMRQSPTHGGKQRNSSKRNGGGPLRP